MNRFLAVTGILGLALSGLRAESFEVASVKPNKSGDPGAVTRNQPGHFIATNVTARQIIIRAYQLQDVQLIGGPGWITSDRFDIDAREPAGTTQTQVPAMLQSLLADRFKLVVHNEKREISILALVLARRDGKLGPNLKRSDVDCDAMAAAAAARGGAPPPLTPGQRPPCSSSSGPGRISGGSLPISRIIPMLAQLTQTIVVDRTGLTGGYDIDLIYTPDQIPPGPLPPGVPAVDPDGPSLFTALQEQLGLKLESQKSPVDVVVIDSIAPPTEN